jgi:hypothetical protein
MDMAEAKSKRDRSPAFPQVPLGEAVDRLIAFEKKFTRHPAPFDKAGSAWGLKQVGDILASLRYYGLIEYTGEGDLRQVVITEDGRNLIRAQQPSVKQQFLQKAALRPKEIAKFWPTWGADRPPDDVCLDELIMRNGFSRRGAPLFLHSYDAAIVAAGLASSGKIATDSAERATDKPEVDDDTTDDNEPPPPPAHRNPPPPTKEISIMEGERVVFTEESDPPKYVKLIANGEIDETLLDALSSYVTRQRKRLGIAGRPQSAPRITRDCSEEAEGEGEPH